MENNTLDFVQHRKLKALKIHVKELKDMKFILSNTLVGLTKYDKYSSVKRVLEDLFNMHIDIKRAIDKKEEILKRLENE
jgi:hypothetical protein